MNYNHITNHEQERESIFSEILYYLSFLLAAIIAVSLFDERLYSFLGLFFLSLIIRFPYLLFPLLLAIVGLLSKDFYGLSGFILTYGLVRYLARALRPISTRNLNIFTDKLSSNKKKEAFYVCFSLGLLILSSLTTNSISASVFLVFIGFQVFIGYRVYQKLQINKVRKFRQGKIWKFFLYGFLSCFSLIAGIILIFSTRFKSEPYKFTNVTANTVYITPLLNATPEDGFYRKASTVVFPFGIPITTNGGHSRTKVEPGKSVTFDFDYESIRQAKHFLLVEKNENYYLLDALFFSSSISSGDLLEDKTSLQPANKAAVDKGNHTRYRLHIQLLLLLFLLTITLYFPYCWIKELWFLIRNFIPLKIKMRVMKMIT